jgi:hypothetical protein
MEPNFGGNSLVSFLGIKAGDMGKKISAMRVEIKGVMKPRLS